MKVTTQHRMKPRLALTALVLAAVGLTSGCAAASTSSDPVAIPEPAPAATGALTQNDVDAWLDGMLPAALEEAGIAGATVSVVHDGSILTTRGFGVSDAGTGSSPRRSVDPDRDLFRVGSISKLFSATAVMQLVERGDLELDADVNEYLDFDLAEPYGPITLRNLLTHTAGFEERVSGVFETADDAASLRGFLTADQPEVIFPPGEVPAYSNYGNSLAGYVVETVSGIPFADYVQQNILEPAGMSSSTFDQPLPDELRKRMSAGYPDVSQQAIPFETIAASPAGALSATATDMGRFMLAQLGDVPPAQAILDPETLSIMQKPALDDDTLGSLASAPRMTLGFFQEDRNGHRILGHLGDTTAFHSALELFPDERTGVFISMNSTGVSGEAGAIRESLMNGFADRYFPANGEDTTAAETVDRGGEPDSGEHARMAVGSYESSRGMRSTFLSSIRLMGQTQVSDRGDGTILISPGPEETTPAVYRETKPWVWQEVGGQRTIAMRVDGDRVTSIGYDSAFTLLRVDGSNESAITVPLTIGSLVILLLGAVVPITGRVARRYLAAPRRPGAGGRGLRILTSAGIVATIVAAVGWFGVILTALGSQTVPDAVIRVLQALQVVGALGIIPAVLSVIATIRARDGWTRIAGRVLIVAALAEMTWFALVFKLISPDISY